MCEYPLLTEQYLYAAEPEFEERASAWDVAIGLQAVDGLEVSEYLREVAGDQIEGLICFDEVHRRLASYYSGQGGGCSMSDEADKVAANIAEMLNERKAIPAPRLYSVSSTCSIWGTT